MRAYHIAEIRHQYGYKYASPQWQNSPTLEYLKSLPSNQMIVSNGPDVVFVYTKRASHMIPEKFNTQSRQIRKNYTKELEKIDNQLKNEKGLLIYFKKITYRPYLIPLEELNNHLKFKNTMDFSDSRIFIF